MKLRLPLALLLLLLGSFTGYTQSAKTDFGRNRLQFKEFNWQYYSSSNFDVYFYDDGEKLARLTAEYLEDGYQDITELIGYSPYTKTKIFLYNSVADLQQSNVGVNQSPFAVGGQANFVKTQVEVAFPGTLSGFRQKLQYELTKTLVMDMMFGGSLRDVFQSAYLLTLPEWYIEGIARYVAYGWGVEMDDYIRQTEDLEGNLKFYRLQGREAALMGQAVWNYIAEKHGRSSISNILNYTRIVRNGETAIANTLGVPFRTFQSRFREFYSGPATEELAEYSRLPEEAVVEENRKATRDNAFNSLALSPGGNFLAYSESNRGRYRIKLRNLNNGKSDVLIRTGYRALDQELDDTIPLLAWQDSLHLGIFSVNRGLYTLYIVNTDNGDTEEHIIRKVSQINDFSFSPNGKVVVMSAEKEGRNDIYLYSLGRRSLTAVTNDWYDDVTPTFVPGSNNIVFSSNRTTDTLASTNRPALSEIPENYNLFLFNVDTTNEVLARLTNQIGKNYKPQADTRRNIYFLSNQKGIYNLYRYGLDDGLVWQTTTNASSFTDYSVDAETGGLAYIGWQNGDEKIFYQRGVNLQNNSFTAPTRRQSIWQIRYVKENANKAAAAEAAKPRPAPADSVIDTDSVIAADSLAVLTPPDSLAGDTLANRPPADSLSEPNTPPADTTTTLASTEEPGLIDPENYQFDQPAAVATVSTETAEESRRPAPIRTRESFLSSYRRNRKREEMRGPFRMEPRFLINSFTLNFAFDPLRASLEARRDNTSPFFGGLGLKLEAQISDLLENQKFYGGAFLSKDLRSGAIFAEYEYLKHYVDFRIRYDRNVVLDRIPSTFFQINKYTLDKGQFSFLYPFSHNTRLEIGPMVANTQYLPIFDFQNNAELRQARSTFMGGGQARLVYDDTRVLDFNILNGSRGFAEFSILEGINNNEQGFGKFLLDLRHYQRLSRNITLAGRFYYGRFIGRNEPYFILGGVDNALASGTEISSRPNNPYFEPEQDNNELLYQQDNRNLLFYDFATPLRGYKFNAMHGTNAMVMNLELRAPIVQYFYRGPITSNFFRNLQFTGFVDVGTAWSGSSWYPKDGANTGPLNQEPVTDGEGPGGPFVITVTDYSNPWLSGYGGGIRTVVLGYYAKVDVAWPMQDYEVGKPRFHVSLGFDF